MPTPRFQFSLLGLLAFTTFVAIATYLSDTSHGLMIAAVLGFAMFCCLKAARMKDD